MMIYYNGTETKARRSRYYMLKEGVKSSRYQVEEHTGQEEGLEWSK